MRKVIYAITVAASMMLASCSKKDAQPEPEKKPDPIEIANAAKKLENDVLGKWTFTNAIFPKTSSVNGMKSPSANHVSRSSSKLSAIANTSDVVPRTGFIEFLNDNTYLIYDAKGNSFSGKFEAKDGQTINLAGFGTINDIRFVQGKIEFKITYSSASQTINISASKAIAMTSDERTKMLCRSWEFISIEENGESVQVNGKWEIYGGQDANGHDIIIPADKVSITFSPSGTYLMRGYDKDKLIAANVFYWKWHPTNQNKFMDYGIDFNLDDTEEEDYATITELTADVLKIEFTRSVDNKIVERTKMHLRPIQQ